MKPLLSAVAAFFVASLLYSLQNQPAETSQKGTVTIKIDAGKPAGSEIPQTIFGSFLEPIGNSTYNGLWAEILQNSSFESGLWSASNIERMVHDEPPLARASQLGLPIPWEPLDPREGNRYEPRRGDAANSWESLAIFGVPGKETGIKQRVYLPMHRELRYKGSLYARHLSGPAGLDISIRKAGAPEQVFSHAQIEAASADWRKYSFDLELGAGQIRPLEPADFVIAVQPDERTIVDGRNRRPRSRDGGNGQSHENAPGSLWG
jgi:alpha-L-arabinofuranosidase